MSAAILDSVVALISREFPMPAVELGANTPLDALSLDSLDRVALAGAVEDTFHVAVDDGEEQDWETVGDIVAWLSAAGVAA